MKKPLRALLVVRSDAHTRPGGDIVHAERAQAALRELSVDATIVSDATPNPDGFDVAHVFGVFHPEIHPRQIAALRSSAVPLVLSPIWLDLREFTVMHPDLERALALPDSRTAAALARARRGGSLLRRWSRQARDARRRFERERALIMQADVVLPASVCEAELYRERLGAEKLSFVVAPLGVDEQLFSATPTARRGLMCAARIEPKKNQALLLYALRNVDVDVTLVGEQYDREYLELCRRWATPRTHFVEHRSHAKTVALMRGATVHALPSWNESPGLSSLEAAAGGSHVVVGNRGTEREYFGAGAFYADPTDPDSIREAALEALAQPPREPGDSLEQRLRTFTWRRHAEATLEAYQRAIALRSG